jgi:transcriptional regulator with XRE-family HTH domain
MASKYINLSLMENGTEDFADYVRRVRASKSLSLAEVETRSGGRISRGYVSQIENRHVLGERVTPDKLRSLAAGLGVPEDEVFARARGKSPADDPNFNKSRFAELALKFDKLPPDSRIDVEALINLLDRELERLNREKKRKT